MNQLQQPINYTNHYMIQQFFKSNLDGVPHDLLISYNPQILGRLPYYSQSTNFHYHGQVNSKVKLISTPTINPISQFIVLQETWYHDRDHQSKSNLLRTMQTYSASIFNQNHLLKSKSLVQREFLHVPQVIYVISTIS